MRLRGKQMSDAKILADLGEDEILKKDKKKLPSFLDKLINT
jgi:hypothetical protein